MTAGRSPLAKVGVVAVARGVRVRSSRIYLIRLTPNLGSIHSVCRRGNRVVGRHCRALDGTSDGVGTRRG